MGTLSGVADAGALIVAASPTVGRRCRCGHGKGSWQVGVVEGVPVEQTPASTAFAGDVAQGW